MTRGGPFFSTTTLVTHIYNTGFVSWDLSYAATMATVLFCLILVVTLIQRRYTGVDVGVEED